MLEKFTVAEIVMRSKCELNETPQDVFTIINKILITYQSNNQN